MATMSTPVALASLNSHFGPRGESDQNCSLPRPDDQGESVAQVTTSDPEQSQHEPVEGQNATRQDSASALAESECSEPGPPPAADQPSSPTSGPPPSPPPAKPSSSTASPSSPSPMISESSAALSASAHYQSGHLHQAQPAPRVLIKSEPESPPPSQASPVEPYGLRLGQGPSGATQPSAHLSSAASGSSTPQHSLMLSAPGHLMEYHHPGSQAQHGPSVPSQAGHHQQAHHQHHHHMGPPHPSSQPSMLGLSMGGQGGGSVAVVTAASSSPSSDPKDCIEEMCPVCGDRVSGYHYGLLTCESCKGFFKRTVQNKKVYTCVADRNCHIDKSQRKRCPYCRFQKCLDVGMKLEAVRADRMRGGRNKFGPMYKRDRARRLQLLRQKQLAKVHHVTGPAGGTLLPGAPSTETLTFINSASGSHALFDSVKQELIQIPQLSSSTSSPDSSPSPGTSAAPGQMAPASAASASAGNHHFMPPLSLQAGMQQTGVAGASLPTPPEHLLKWANGPGTSQSVAPSGGKSSSVSQYESQAGASSVAPPGKVSVPGLVRELQLSMPDDKDWQTQLFCLLQTQTYNQCEVDLFELMCKVIDQSLFAQVDWARNSIFFKDLKVDDQMKLLQHAWSDMLVLDHIHQRLHVGLPDETTLPNGQKFDLLSLALLGVPQVVDQLHRVSARLQELKVDANDYICLKFLLLLNPEVRGLNNYKLVHEAHEQTKQALHEYTVNFYPQITDKFSQLLSLVPEIRSLTIRGEDFLYYKHVNGSAPTQTLLMEMLHAKKK